MDILSDSVQEVYIPCTNRLNELLERFYDYRLKRGNVWFNENKKIRLDEHLRKISRQIRRHILKQNPNVLVAVSLKRVFGKNGYTCRLLVSKGENKC